MYTNSFCSNNLANSATLVIVVAVYSICITSLVQSTRISSPLAKKGEHLIGLRVPSYVVRHKRENDQPPAGSDPAGNKNKVDDKQATLTSTTASPNVEGNLINCSKLTNPNKTECLPESNDKSNNDLDKNYIKLVDQKMVDNKDMLMRTLYVTLGVTAIVVVYFVARSFWLRRKHTKSRQYGVVTRGGNHRDMEMEPLGDGNDDDDEDYTVFEANGRKK